MNMELDLQQTSLWLGIGAGVLVALVAAFFILRKGRSSTHMHKPDKTYYGRQPDYSHFAGHQQTAA